LRGKHRVNTTFSPSTLTEMSSFASSATSASSHASSASPTSAPPAFVFFDKHSEYLDRFPGLIENTMQVLPRYVAPDGLPDNLMANMTRRYAELVRKEATGTLNYDESLFLSMYVNANIHRCVDIEVEIAIMKSKLGRDLAQDLDEKRDFLQNLHLFVLGKKAETDRELDRFLDNYGELVLPEIGQYWRVIRMDFVYVPVPRVYDGDYYE